MPGGGQSGWQRFVGFLEEAAEWVREHEDEIRFWGLWGAVGTTGRKAHLYVPLHPESWERIQAASHDDEVSDYEALIVSLYAPDGPGFGALCEELSSAPLLDDRRGEVGEVLDSLVDERFYLVVCGALPLVEYTLSRAAGKWSDPRKHLEGLRARLHEPAAFSADAENALLLEGTAVEMILHEIPEVWRNGPQTVGAISEKLNRHLALHGTGIGWDDKRNAMRAVLLLAAVARIAEPLFEPASTSS
jgi:hypothetical protein